MAKDCTLQVPYSASLSEKYTQASSEPKALFQTGIKNVKRKHRKGTEDIP